MPSFSSIWGSQGRLDATCWVVCLFVWGFSSLSRIFHSFGDVTITDGGLQILTYSRHSWPLNSEGSLTCHTYCDIGQPFIMVISDDPWHSRLLTSVWQWSCHYLFWRLRSVLDGDWACAANALPLRCVVWFLSKEPFHNNYKMLFCQFYCNDNNI